MSIILSADFFNQNFLAAVSNLMSLLFLIQAGNKASATIQPFLLLHLNISPDPVFTIEHALHIFSAAETLEGYRAASRKVWSLVCCSYKF